MQPRANEALIALIHPTSNPTYLAVQGLYLSMTQKWAPVDDWACELKEGWQELQFAPRNARCCC